MSGVWTPPGKQTFLDPDTGQLLALGKVYMYVPSTTTFKTTWADEGQTQVNTNPINLDGSGQCSIWGTGLYRQIVRDQDGNQLWDKVTGFSGPSDGGDTAGVLANISVLRAYAQPITNDAAIYVNGYSTFGDGGEGWFSIDVNDTTTPDNGGTVIVDALSRRWFRDQSGVFSVKWFGATGDGVTDDIIPIQACVDAAADVGASVLVPAVPEGLFYRITTPIIMRNGSYITGEGRNSFIWNTRTVNTNFNGMVFSFGCFGAQDIPNLASVNLDPIAAYDSTVTTATAADAADYEPGSIVLIYSDDNTGTNPLAPRPVYCAPNRVLTSSGVTGEITLANPIDSAISSPKIGRWYDGMTNSVPGLPSNMLDGGYLGNMRVRVSSNVNWAQRTGAYESVVENMWLDRVPALIDGNGMAYCRFSGFQGTITQQVTSMAIGSIGSVVEDFDLSYVYDANVSVASRAIFNQHENQRFCTVRNGRVTYPATTNGTMSKIINLAAKGARLYDIDVYGARGIGIDLANPIDGGDAGDYDDNQVTRLNLVDCTIVSGVRHETGSGNQTNFLVDGLRMRRGTATLALNMDGGTNGIIRNCLFTEGDIDVASASTNLTISNLQNASDEWSITDAGTGTSISKLVSPSWLQMQRVIYSNTNITTTNSTSANNVIDQVVIPAGTLKIGDVIEVWARTAFTGSAGSHTLALTFGATTIGTYSTSNTGGLISNGNIEINTAAGQRSNCLTYRQTSIVDNTRATPAETINSSSIAIQLQGWVANSADSVGLDGWGVNVFRRYYS